MYGESKRDSAETELEQWTGICARPKGQEERCYENRKEGNPGIVNLIEHSSDLPFQESESW